MDNYIEIDTKIINNNIKKITEERPGYKYYIMVIKGNCYGHGFELLKYLDKTYINTFAVATYEEAKEARTYLDKKYSILILQPINLSNIDDAVKNNFIITLSSYDYYNKLIKLNNIHGLKIHLKLNTGMNRLGLDNPKEINTIYNDLVIDKKYNITLDGIYSHLSSFGIVDKLFDNQIDKFKELTSSIDLSKINMIHLYSSSSLSIHPKVDFCNGVRIGKLVFGLNFDNFNTSGLINNLKNIKRNIVRNRLKLSPLNENMCIDVKPAFSLYSTVSEVRFVEKGTNVGYDGEYVTTNDEYIAVVPIGYSNGLNRKFSNGYVTINNKKYKIVSAINMCMMLVSVDSKVKVNDNVTIIGKDLDIKTVPDIIHENSLSILCGLKENIKRIYK